MVIWYLNLIWFVFMNEVIIYYNEVNGKEVVMLFEVVVFENY